MRIRILWMFCFGVVALAQQATPSAQAPAPTNEQLPATIDSLNERETRLFERFDRNGDGLISLEE